MLWWAWTKWCILGVNFSKHVLAKTMTMQRININTPSIFNLVPSNLTSWQNIAEDVNRSGEFWKSASTNYFLWLKQGSLYAANGEFSSNTCRKLMMHTVKNPQYGIRVQMVQKTLLKVNGNLNSKMIIRAEFSLVFVRQKNNVSIGATY